MALVEEEKGGCGEESVSSGVEAGEEDPLNSSSDAEIGRDCSSVSALMETPSLLLCDDLSGSGEGKGTKLLVRKVAVKLCDYVHLVVLFAVSENQAEAEDHFL